MGPKVLVVDDKRDFAKGVALVLEDVSDDIRVCHSAEEALALLRDMPTDILLSDIRMDGMGGLSLLDVVSESWPATKVILLTGFGTVASAVDAMKRGAYDYLTKPVDPPELVALVTRAWNEIQLQQTQSDARNFARGDGDFHGIYTRDQRMVPVIEGIRRAAASDATVLIYGQSGTGKELVARALHAESKRAAAPFVAFSAAAVVETLVEAELFGSRKGAFTGADRDRKGLFCEAEGGTLFIDEVSSMPMTLQTKLLRVIQEREVMAVGASSPTKIDIRLVTATNVEPRVLLEREVLRTDLYYRLSVVKIALPPLRVRPDDIPLLIEVFLARHTEWLSLERPFTLSPSALRLLLSHDWPGNVRELQNVIERAAIMGAGGEIGPGDIQFEDDDPAWETDEVEGYQRSKRAVMERFQRRYVERLLAKAEGNVSAAARSAGITRAALYKMVKRLEIDPRGP